MDHKSMLNPIIHAEGLLRSAINVKTADCTAPITHIHVVSDNWAGYLFRVDAWISNYKQYIRFVMISERTSLLSFRAGPSQI